MKRKTILNAIKAKGGLYGRAVEMYMNDDEKADQFIRECAEQCHNRLAQELWGEELVSEILNFSGIKMENIVRHLEVKVNATIPMEYEHR